MKQYLKKLSALLLTITLLTGIILIPGMTASAAVIESGTLITFGSYPQTSVISPAALEVLNSKNVSWRSYKYMVKGVETDIMEYADVSDVFEPGDKYRAVKINDYRPISTIDAPSDAEYSYQDDAIEWLIEYRNSGYDKEMIYWFKYEPLVWRVYDPDSGLIVSENVIDAQAFHNYRFYSENKKEYYGDKYFSHFASNWAYSTLRSWMNTDFFNTAFNAEKNYVRNTSLETPFDKDDLRMIWEEYYDADPTVDRVFPTTDYYSSSCAFTDYARCQGVCVKTHKDGSPTASWGSRTPFYSGSICDDEAPSYFGDEYKGNPTCNASTGVLPSLEITDFQTAVSESIIKIIDDDYRFENNGPAGTSIEEAEHAAKHSLTHTDAKSPTCIDPGNIEYWYCDDCGKYFKDADATEEIAPADIVIPATGVHTWDAGTVSVEPTCLTTGLKMYICTVCGEPRSEVIPKTEHTLEHVHNPSTCTVKGVDYDVCTNDGDENIYNKTVLDLAPHTWDEGVVTTPATAAKDGVMTYTCTVCGATKTEKIPKLQSCEHVWDAGVATVAATCAKDGVMTYTCTVCGATKTEVIPATGIHTFGPWNYTAVPTYRDGGKATRTCTVCGYVEEKTFDPITPDYTEHDEETNVEIDYMEETYDKRKVDLEITNIFDGDSYNFLNKEKGNFDFKIYDIKTKIDNKEVQPNGKVLVKLPIPANYDRSKLRIYHVTSEGVVEPVDMWIDGDYACFEAEHFSAYALVDESQSKVAYGDVNMDGQVLANDARLALRASASLEQLDPVPALVADVDGNGKILANDARQILRFSAKLQKEFEKA